MDLDQYLGIFIDESKENLQKLNESLLKLEQNVDDLEILNDIFRVAHTLKGMAKTMGFNSIGDLTHHMENILEPLRNGTVLADEKIINTLFKCLDRLEELVGRVIDGTYEDNASDNHELITSLQTLLDNLSNTQPEKQETKEILFNEYELTVINNAREKGFRPIEIKIFLEKDCVLPGARAYMAVQTAESFGELVKTHPNTEDLENGEFNEVFYLYLLTQEQDENIISKINSISEISSVSLQNINTTQVKRETQYNTQQDTEIIANNQNTDIKDTKTNEQFAATKVVPQTIRVNANRLDKLMNLVGELVINRTRISQLSNDFKLNDLSSTVGLLENITGDIQEIVMKLRMVPIEQVFNRFPRLVRDISKEQNKEINLKITGKDTEIDRVVIDEIGDPLVHLIRNSLDHGLEPTEERISAGKLSKGTLELSAFNEGDNIIIKVSDDGRGIDPEKIKSVAISKGIITSEVAKTMSENEALELIFRPGFSTAKVATDISGRGVGMDVVKSKVSSLGGNVSIVSKKGIGSTITISLPSTMAIVQALLIKVGPETYAAPLNYISEVIDVHPNQIKNVQNKEVIILRGNTLPLIRLNRLLEVPNFKEDPNKSLTVVIAKTHDKYIGVIVSELIGQQEVVIKPVNKRLCSDDYISGATTLGNGQVALIINVNALIKG